MGYMKKPKVVTLKSNRSGNPSLKTLYDKLVADEKEIRDKNKNSPTNKIYEEIKDYKRDDRVIWIDEKKLNKILKIIGENHSSMNSAHSDNWKQLINLFLSIANVKVEAGNNKELSNLESCTRTVGSYEPIDTEVLKDNYTYEALVEMLNRINRSGLSG